MKINLKIPSLCMLLLAAFAMLGCNGGKNQPNIELIQDMMDQRALKSQKWDSLRNKPEEMVPPANTVPRGFKPYPYHNQPLVAEAKLVNPYAGDKFQSTLKRGKDRFDIYCAPCHGFDGKGDGTVAQYMPLKPPNLMQDMVRKFKDGRIYHIITDGQGLMQPYDTQIYKASDRWAIVNYVRYLQKRTPDDGK